MKIAISTEDKNGLESLVSYHFGRCPSYVFVDVKDQQVQLVVSVDNPFAEQHQPGMVPGFIRSQGADVMLSGGMGRRAISIFEQYGIETATGASGTVQNALDRYFAGQLSGADPCRESVEHQKHGHHHHGDHA